MFLPVLLTLLSQNIAVCLTVLSQQNLAVSTGPKQTTYITVSLTLLGQTNQNLHKTEQCLYTQEKKNKVYTSSPVTKLLDRIQLGLENPVLHYEGSAESRNSATTIMCRINCLYPVPHTSLVIWGDRYIYCNPLFKLLPERPWVPLCSIPCTDRADCPSEENERL